MIVGKIVKQKIYKVLKSSGIIAFPTDTVWGIGCSPFDKKSVEKIYNVKQREKNKPLILMSNSVENLKPFVKDFNDKALFLADKYWPGALTICLEKSNLTPDYITQKFSSVGLRIPNNEVFLEMIESTPEKVLATTSANLSGELPVTNEKELENLFGKEIDLVIPQKESSPIQNIASTVVGISTDGCVKVFRQGTILINFD